MWHNQIRQVTVLATFQIVPLLILRTMEDFDDFRPVPLHDDLAGERRDCDSPSSASTPSRHEKSLGLLTSRFVALLQEAKDGVLDLKKVSDVFEFSCGILIVFRTCRRLTRWPFVRSAGYMI